MNKRYCICVFYDKKGIVQDYFLYYLKELKKVVTNILVVVNGDITEDGRSKLCELGVEIFQRENSGLDFGAWKVALERIGYENLAQYDELILTNNTCYGPIYPFSEMFEEMSKRSCDFWGITKHIEVDYCVIKNDISTKIIEHIQSYFLVFRKNVFLSNAFKDWWDNVKLYNDYDKVVGFYEIKLTKYFEDYGFISDSYVDKTLHSEYSVNPMLVTDIILKEVRMPLIKRKLFSEKYSNLYRCGCLNHSAKTFGFVNTNTCYDTNLILSDLLSSQPISNIVNNLSLCYSLSSQYQNPEQKSDKKVALVMYIYYEDNVNICLQYAASMPEYSDIFIISSKESTLELCKQSNILKGYNVTYILKENRGRDVSAYLISARDVFKNYDLICCVHDKKSPDYGGCFGQDFQQICFESCLKNDIYVKNIINKFLNEPRLGLLCPLPLNFYSLNLIGSELGSNYNILKDLFKKLNLSIPFDYHPPVAFGSMFWIRGEAIQPLFRHNWKYEDFPDEPLPIDGTVSHAIERVYSFICQEAGFYTAYCCPDSFVSGYLISLFDTIQKSNSLLYKLFGVRTPANILEDKRLHLSYDKFFNNAAIKKFKYKLLYSLNYKTKHYSKKYNRIKCECNLLNYLKEADMETGLRSGNARK